MPLSPGSALFFEPSTGRTGERFYVRVDFASDMTSGAVADGDTIKWWMAQSSEARAELVADFALPTSLALMQLNQFIAANQFPAGRKYLRVWGNGAHSITSFCAQLMRVQVPKCRGTGGTIWMFALSLRWGECWVMTQNAVTPLQARAITRLMTPCFRPSTYQNSGSA
jgi:hypothetical protein